jgi:hypothetical protein
MERRIVRIVLGVALFALGWVAARAQQTSPDFVIAVSAPEGATNIRCVRGCRLAWVERGLNPNATPMDSFDYQCRGPERCVSGQIGGWLVPPAH